MKIKKFSAVVIIAAIMILAAAPVAGEYNLPPLNGELVVNGEIIEGAPEPFWLDAENGSVLMIPVRAVAEALGYDVYWDAAEHGVRLGVAVNLWIGSYEAHVGRMAPIELSAAPLIKDGRTFVPIDFIRNVLGQYAYVFEGQTVVETETDMF